MDQEIAREIARCLMGIEEQLTKIANAMQPMDILSPFGPDQFADKEDSRDMLEQLAEAMHRREDSGPRYKEWYPEEDVEYGTGLSDDH